MNKEIRNRLLVIAAVLIGAIIFGFPIDQRINLGLDLKGGMHMILKVETEKLDEKARGDAVVRAIEIIRNRIDALGTGETVIQRQGQDQIIVQLPGITDRDKAIQMIGTVAKLDFHLVNSDENLVKEAVDGSVPQGYLLKYTKEDNSPVLIEERPAVSGDTIADAMVDFQSQSFGEPKVSLTFTAEGSKTFAKVTQEHVNERLAIILDGVVLSAPNIREPILNGRAEISGRFDHKEASLLALNLRSGSLPAPMRIEEERTVGPLLGKDSINAGLRAAIFGGAAVFIFMMIYYLTAGIIADIALAMNLLLIIGTMGFLNAMMPGSQVTLTLPGIAGIILTLGMAVDANVLINERIREEINNGRPIRAAVNSGFSKAFNAIIDSNITTLLAAAMLYNFGSGPIKGFAVTLIIGLCSSLFTALFVSRTLFMLLLNLNMLKSLPMMNIFRDTKIDFLSKRYICFAMSIILIGIGMFTLVKKGPEAYGIDFAGGQIQEYRFQRPIPTEEFRELLSQNGMGEFIIQRFEQIPENVMVRTAGDTFNQVKSILDKKMPDNPYEVLRIENVGPIVGKALKRAALLAIICAMGGILVYVGFRFKHFDFAAAGVVALVHDVVITLGLAVLLDRQIDLLMITALLTIAGYSINDTIIIYDRVRENTAKMPRSPLGEIINLSVNQTLGRTILTTVTTLFVVISLYFLGGEVLNTFALCLVIGFLTGTYSTVFIASPVVLALQKKKK